jgi:hypothetical protein
MESLSVMLTKIIVVHGCLYAIIMAGKMMLYRNKQ